MREIVDKYFSDNWVVPFYMGFTIDLSVVWETFRAAKLALKNILQKKNITAIAVKYAHNVDRLNVELTKYLTKGG